MVNTVQQLCEAEKALDLPGTEEEQEVASNCSTGTTSQQKVDGQVKSVLDKLVKRMWEAQHDSDVSKLDQLIGWLDKNHEYCENVRGCDGRTILHAAVENENTAFVKTLITAGVDVHAKEMCGATPLTIAVVKKNDKLSELLIQNFAMFDSRYFTTIPSLMTIAEKLDMNIVGTMKKISDIGLADNYEIWRPFFCAEQASNANTRTSDNPDPVEPAVADEVYEYKRSNKSCITLTVG